MDCLSNFVGFSKYCGLPESESGYYIASLPGISTEMADKIANTDQVTFDGVWNDVNTIAFLKLKTDVLAALAEKATFNQVLYQTKLPKRAKGVIAASAEQRGIFVAVPESRFGQVKVKNIILYSQSAATATLKIIDTIENEEILSREIAIVEGYNSIAIDYTIANQYSESSYFIGIDTAGLTLGSFEYDAHYYDFHECTKVCRCSQDLEIYPAIYYNDTVNDFYTRFSVWATIDIVCSLEAFLCENKTSLIEPLMYLFGSKLLDFKLNNGLSSSRMNFFTNSNSKQTEITRDEYKADYEKSLKRALKGLPLEDSLCFGCAEEPQVKYIATLP